MRKPQWMLAAWVGVLVPADSSGPVALESLMPSGLHWLGLTPRILGIELSWAIAGRHEVSARLWRKRGSEFLCLLMKVWARG